MKTNLRFIVDECTGRKIFLSLVLRGIDSEFVGEIMPGASDEDVLAYAEKEKRIIMSGILETTPFRTWKSPSIQSTSAFCQTTAFKPWWRIVLLITNDKDFGELIFRLKKPSPGAILLRLRLDTPQRREKYLLETINVFSHFLPSSFTVIMEGRVKIRRAK